jgi:hypothetical protein
MYIPVMDVRLFPNMRRSGLGLKPRREAQRPLLPQHARHCPVLEAGSSLGFLVYPPLEPHESFYIGYEGEGRYHYRYFMKAGGDWQPIFALIMTCPVGGIGKFTEELTYMPGAPPMPKELALHLAGSCFVTADLGTPPGAVTLRGAWSFKTEPGWDTVYTSVFNAIERPSAPVLVVRVETDWYAHETEFRYVLQPGEGISVLHSMPIGQAFFVPREQLNVVECNRDELDAIRRSQEEFQRGKASIQLTTPYGLPYSPHYLRRSRAENPSASPQDAAVSAAPSQDADRKLGRNDPCWCGSGRKFKHCHGRT